MKKLLTIAIGFACTVGFAASCSWHAAALDASFNGGTAYLVEVSKSGVTSTTIKDALTTTGIATSLDGYKVGIETGTVSLSAVDYTSFLGNYSASNLENPFSYTNNDVTSMNVFVIVLSQDQKKFIMSDILAVDGEAGYVVTPGTNADWDATDPSAWAYSGDVAPEPTVLALLALGVAGVALRRKAA